MNKNKLRKVPTLDSYERELERSFANDEWIEVSSKKERQKAIVAAKASKTERTNIRLPLEDLEGIKQKATDRGLGYQTLIASIVHQYLNGSLIESDDTMIKKLVAQTLEQLSQSNKARAHLGK